MKSLGHAEDGSVIETVDFPYADIYARDENVQCLETDPELNRLSAEELRLGMKTVGPALRWVWQYGMKNKDGIAIRAILLCRAGLPELGGLTMTRLANGFGLAKQSLDRWDKDLASRYPKLRINWRRQ